MLLEANRSFANPGGYSSRSNKAEATLDSGAIDETLQPNQLSHAHRSQIAGSPLCGGLHGHRNTQVSHSAITNIWSIPCN